ncbi:prepilin-type cleavage/methylation domain-containing protein [Desulfobacter hydrogenophilus]|uniref:Prepilin-type N-terminal cleavage/methylation domain-containing protein n=1 Tax=Desulfobacter hydrogenophilus TaxID=2291 RepID=A0A328FLA1_9BACT|nr:prepilin-type N-terminal cleavage/methylation domain-containing protein [Desulfobacter hydrogenophilus]NDY71796.1 prepilin-type N-terminal cleavage/methylation domain-containing protein [Desulfobacter hydrogenophilus]QBH13494.1 prepilin-type N-terminal cleavage/methylation domain-containing protein [Desulfobacter hydrogenophilus]RAM03745.1 prepilin-type cleavage/methylation domain-containing protein [Desulfobacter hydrogenophilus]
MAVNNQKGFTLIELMMTLVIGAMITGAAYATYLSQQKAYYTQDQVAEMQQNLRAAFSIIAIDLRMAGYDPTASGNFSVTPTNAGRIQFETDTDGDGVLDSDETFVIGLEPSVDADGNGIPEADSDGDGVPDPVNIVIKAGGGGYQDIAEQIQAVEFLYIDSNEAVTATPSDVRSVQITILAASPKKDTSFTNTTQYKPPSPSGQTWGPYNDNYRRRLRTLRIRCRNLGL